MSDFTPDVLTCRWLIQQLVNAAEHHQRISGFLTSGTDRAVRKATAASSLALAQYLTHIIGLVEAGNWPPKEESEALSGRAKELETVSEVDS